ncbi:MAG: hypothetical protein LBL80_04295 [Ruminococcus sp.]|jgi:hypothetical protein|nr:hypothetical protein [Ruminococcus sp.]
MGIIKKAALKATRKAAANALKSTAGDVISTLGSKFLSDFEGEFELKNGRFVVVKSVGSPDNPTLQFSVHRKPAAARAKELILKSIAISIAISLISVSISKLFSNNRRR